MARAVRVACALAAVLSVGSAARATASPQAATADSLRAPPGGPLSASQPAAPNAVAPFGPRSAVSPPLAAAAESAPATLSYFNRPIVTLRASVMGQAPHARVESAEVRIEATVRRGYDGAANAQAIPEGALITISDHPVFTIVHEDADLLAGESFDDLRASTLAHLTTALAERREAHSTRALLRAGGLTLAALLLVVGLFWLIRLAFTRLERRLTTRAQRLSGRTMVRGLRLISEEQMTLGARGLARATAWILRLLVIYWWVSFALRQFPFARPWGQAMRGYLLSGLLQVLLAIAQFVPKALVLIVIFVATRFAMRLVTLFFSAVELKTIDAPEALRETAQPTRRLVVILMWVFALVVAYPYLPGSGSDAFKGVSVFVGLMVSLGSSGVVGQVMSGFLIMYSRALRPGDYVRIGEHEGVVMSLGLLSTKIRTNKREEINVPNNQLVSSTTKNYTRLAGSDGAILYTSVTIGYNAPWRQVHAMLSMAAARTPQLRATPAPWVAQVSLSDFYVEYQLNAHLESPEVRMAALVALNANIQDVFNEHGVQIMSPHYEADPAEKVWVPRAKWFEAPAAPSDSAAAPRSNAE